MGSTNEMAVPKTKDNIVSLYLDHCSGNLRCTLTLCHVGTRGKVGHYIRPHDLMLEMNKTNDFCLLWVQVLVFMKMYFI